MQNQSSTKNSHCVIGDYQGSSNCGVLFASSIRKFKVKVWFNLVNGKQKGQAKSNYIYGIVIVLRWCRWPGSPSHLSSERKALPDKIFHEFNSFYSQLAERQEHQDLWNAIPILWFAFLFSESKIKHSCKTSLVSQMLTRCCQHS